MYMGGLGVPNNHFMKNQVAIHIVVNWKQYKQNNAVI